MGGEPRWESDEVSSSPLEGVTSCSCSLSGRHRMCEKALEDWMHWFPKTSRAPRSPSVKQEPLVHPTWLRGPKETMSGKLSASPIRGQGLWENCLVVFVPGNFIVNTYEP